MKIYLTESELKRYIKEMVDAPRHRYEVYTDFSEGFAVVELNDKYNFIDRDGDLLSKQWFDNCWNFDEGFARVQLDDKCYFIDKNCKSYSEDEYWRANKNN